VFAKDVGLYGHVLLISPPNYWSYQHYMDEVCPECKRRFDEELDKLQNEFFEKLGVFFQLDT
jgi:hypothetical protein